MYVTDLVFVSDNHKIEFLKHFCLCMNTVFDYTIFKKNLTSEKHKKCKFMILANILLNVEISLVHNK